jgi:hypothetical protein
MRSNTLDGKWLLNFSANGVPFGGGVAIVEDGEVFGGDTVVVFNGEVLDNNTVEINTSNARTVAGMVNVLPTGHHVFSVVFQGTTFTLQHQSVPLTVHARRA